MYTHNSHDLAVDVLAIHSENAEIVKAPTLKLES